MLVLECSVICILYLLQVSENDNKTELVIFDIQKYLHGVTTKVLVKFRCGQSEKCGSHREQNCNNPCNVLNVRVVNVLWRECAIYGIHWQTESDIMRNLFRL